MQEHGDAGGRRGAHRGAVPRRGLGGRPPPGFDAAQVAATSRRITRRRRSAVAGAALAVLAVAGVGVVAGLGGPGGRDGDRGVGGRRPPRQARRRAPARRNAARAAAPEAAAAPDAGGAGAGPRSPQRAATVPDGAAWDRSRAPLPCRRSASRSARADGPCATGRTRRCGRSSSRRCPRSSGPGGGPSPWTPPGGDRGGSLEVERRRRAADGRLPAAGPDRGAGRRAARADGVRRHRGGLPCVAGRGTRSRSRTGSTRWSPTSPPAIAGRHCSPRPPRCSARHRSSPSGTARWPSAHIYRLPRLVYAADGPAATRAEGHQRRSWPPPAALVELVSRDGGLTCCATSPAARRRCPTPPRATRRAGR